MLVKKHFEDISELPANQLGHVYATIHHCIVALKKTLNAKKVYLCTMCDGKRNHLHYQLIPRLPEDVILGSRVFVNQRKVLEDAESVISSLGSSMRVIVDE